MKSKVNSDLDKLKSYFKDQEMFTTSDLHHFYASLNDKLSKKAITWRIRRLVEQGGIYKVHRGMYSIEAPHEAMYVPKPSSTLKAISKDMNKHFPLVNHCTWQFSLLNEFAQHLLNKDTLLLEVPTDLLNDVFDHFQGSSKRTIVKSGLNNNKVALNFNTKLMVVKELVSEAPIIQVGGVYTISLEKLIVDLVVDDAVFENVLEAEKKTIIKNVTDKYIINMGTLKRYANRRNAWPKVKPCLPLLANGNK